MRVVRRKVLNDHVLCDRKVLLLVYSSFKKRSRKEVVFLLLSIDGHALVCGVICTVLLYVFPSV